IDAELLRGLELRERGANDKKTYRVHNKLGEACYVCGTPIARVDFEEHTIYYCPQCQTGGRRLTPYWGFKGRGWDEVAMASRRKTRRRGTPRARRSTSARWARRQREGRPRWGTRSRAWRGNLPRGR